MRKLIALLVFMVIAATSYAQIYTIAGYSLVA